MFSNYLNQLNLKILASFFLASILSFIFTPFIIRFAKKYKLIDDPKKRKHPAHTHKGKIPRAGGLAIYLAILITFLCFLPLSPIITAILISATIITIVGLLDDKYDLNPYFRFLTNIIAVSITIIAGANIPYITNPLTSGVLHLNTLEINFAGFQFFPIASICALIWIVWCMNMVNWSKGVDGQLPGFVTIAAIFIGLVSLKFFKLGDQTQAIPILIAAIIAGSYLGFLPFNFYPQKIMPGYSGGTLAGFFLAVLAILTSAKVGTAILVLGIPAADGFYSIVRRILAGKSPFWGDRGHFHHRLLDAGWSKRQIALFYWGVSAILGLISLNLDSTQKLFTFITITTIVGGAYLWITYFSRS